MFFGAYVSFNKRYFEIAKTFNRVLETGSKSQALNIYLFYFSSYEKKYASMMLCLYLTNTLMAELVSRSQIPSWNISWHICLISNYIPADNRRKRFVVSEDSWGLTFLSFHNHFLPVLDSIPFQTKDFSNERTCQLLDKCHLTVYGIILWMEQNDGYLVSHWTIDYAMQNMRFSALLIPQKQPS